MHELACPSCNTPSQYQIKDYLLMCPFCSVTFHLDLDTGKKTAFSDHYIIPNTIDSGTVKELTMEWLRRLHHRPQSADKEYYVVDIIGVSIPLWVVSLEGHTAWKGLIQKQHKKTFHGSSGSDYLVERGQFRRSYRWAVSGRENICETWGLTRLHQPAEDVEACWDGFPLDSTLSRGRLTEESDTKSAYDTRKYFELKYANSLPILGIQISEDEAMRRAKEHVMLYHKKLSELYVDYLTDCQTELEIAGIQLIHTPFWQVSYVYRPKTFYKHFYKPKEKKIIIDGHGKGVLNGQLAISHSDKVQTNSIICGVAALGFLILGASWHPAFFFVALFSLIVSVFSHYIYLVKKAKKEEEELSKNISSKTKSSSTILSESA